MIHVDASPADVSDPPRVTPPRLAGAGKLCARYDRASVARIKPSGLVCGKARGEFGNIRGGSSGISALFGCARQVASQLDVFFTTFSRRELWRTKRSYGKLFRNLKQLALGGGLAVECKKVTDLPDGQTIRGFAYVSDRDTGPMSSATPGRLAQIGERKPPWLVVNHDLASIIVAEWPGRLWAVEVVDPIRAEDFRAIGHVLPLASLPYTRAAAIKVVREVPVAALFGSRGAKVCAVIEASSRLTSERAVLLANARHRDANAARTRIRCRREPGREPITSPDLRDALAWTLAVLASGSGSRVGAGLFVIDGEVGKRAQAVDGFSAWVLEEKHPAYTWLAEPWFEASAALVDAGLAFGVPDLFGEDDRNILATAWRHVIGPDPA